MTFRSRPCQGMRDTDVIRRAFGVVPESASSPPCPDLLASEIKVAALRPTGLLWWIKYPGVIRSQLVGVVLLDASVEEPFKRRSMSSTGLSTRHPTWSSLPRIQFEIAVTSHPL